MDKIYIVITETNDDGDIESGIVDNKYFTDRDEARRAMIKDFDLEKSEFDNTDDTDESHDLDSCALSANMEWSKSWNVIELTK